MKVITFQDIASLRLSPSLCYDWVASMIENKRKALLPPKISLQPSPGVFCNVMPCMIPAKTGKIWGGVKLVTRYPNHTPSLESRILLMDAESGEFLVLMDGTWITAMRTGAVAAHSVMLFAKRDFATVGMMGLGNVARSALLSLLSQVPDRELHIKLLKYKGQEESFAERFREYKNLRFSAVESPREMAIGSDVILSGATYLHEDVCGDDCFEEGVLVQPIHTRGFTSCDLFFDKVFADDLGHVRHFKNFEKFKSFSEVCDVVTGTKPGRESDSERILVYNIGISVHDIFFAASIWRLMEERGTLASLPEIDMMEPTEKFWV